MACEEPINGSVGRKMDPDPDPQVREGRSTSNNPCGAMWGIKKGSREEGSCLEC